MSTDPTPAPSDGLGALLREARERAGLDLSEIAARTHVRRAYLQALEDEDLAALPEDVYARNFVRLFARTVALDPEEAVAAFAALRSRQRGRSSGVFRTDGGGPSTVTPDAAERSTPSRPPPVARPSGAAGPGLPPSVRSALPLVATLVLAGVLIGTAVWGFNRLLFRSDGGGVTAATEQNAPAAASETGADATTDAGADAGTDDAASGLAAPTLPSGDALPAEVLLSVATDPPGAEVSVDAFPLPGTTPIDAVPVTARASRTVRIVREGYVPYEASVDLSADRELTIVLEPVPVADGDTPAADVDGVVVEVREATWLEAYQSTARGEGERLVYTTAQPGERYAFERPIYLHFGNAGGVDVLVDGEPFGPLGSGGAVTGQAFPAP